MLPSENIEKNSPINPGINEIQHMETLSVLNQADKLTEGDMDYVLSILRH